MPSSIHQSCGNVSFSYFGISAPIPILEVLFALSPSEFWETIVFDVLHLCSIFFPCAHMETFYFFWLVHAQYEDLCQILQKHACSGFSTPLYFHGFFWFRAQQFCCFSLTSRNLVELYLSISNHVCLDWFSQIARAFVCSGSLLRIRWYMWIFLCISDSISFYRFVWLLYKILRKCLGRALSFRNSERHSSFSYSMGLSLFLTNRVTSFWWKVLPVEEFPEFRNDVFPLHLFDSKIKWSAFLSVFLLLILVIADRSCYLFQL